MTYTDWYLSANKANKSQWWHSLGEECWRQDVYTKAGQIPGSGSLIGFWYHSWIKVISQSDCVRHKARVWLQPIAVWYRLIVWRHSLGPNTTWHHRLHIAALLHPAFSLPFQQSHLLKYMQATCRNGFTARVDYEEDPMGLQLGWYFPWIKPRKRHLSALWGSSRHRVNSGMAWLRLSRPVTAWSRSKFPSVELQQECGAR